MSIDLKGFRAAATFAVALALANGIWILLDHTVPSWDQSHYLDVTLHYRQALGAHGPLELLRTIHTLDPSRGPLFPILMLPLSYVFGSGPHSGLILNLLLAPVFYIAAGEIAIIVFKDWRARLLTIFFVATMPLLVGLYHEVLQDFLLITLATVSILLLLKTELFTNRRASVALGVAMGLGTLTKVTFPGFILGPLAIVAAQTIARVVAERRKGGSPIPRRIGLNLVWTLGVYLVITLPWYLVNLSATIEYIEWTTEAGQGTGPENPYTLHAIASFTSGVMNSNVSWVLGLAAIVAGLLCIPSIRAWYGRRPLETQRLIGVGLLVSWFLIPYLSIALAHNQDVRLMAAATPALAILLGGAIAAIRWRGARIALIAVTALALIYQTTARVIKIEPSFLGDSAAVMIGSQTAMIPLDSQPIGYEQLPGEDPATPVISYMEDVARGGRQSGEVPPQIVCMLESEPIVNSNTFTFLADSRGDPFTVADIYAEPSGKGLAKSLKGCNLALFVRQAPAASENSDTRLAVVNTSVAARFMTPRLFALFNGPSRSFYLGPPNDGPSNAPYRGPASAGSFVKVLSRE